MRTADRSRPRVLAAVSLVTCCTLLAGCGSARVALPVPLHAAPEPAVSPTPTVPPAGRTVRVGRGPEGLAIAADSATIAVAVRDPTGVDLLDETGGPVRFVPLDGSARHLMMVGGSGPLLAPLETADRLDEVAVPSGRLLESVPVGSQPHDATEVDGTVAVGNEFSNSVSLIRAGRVVGVVPAPLQPGGIDADATDFVVVGVRARLLVAYTASGRRITEAPCGAGPTHVVAGLGGTFYVADTDGDALLVFDLHGASLRQVASIAVGPRPYGLAFDPTTGWVYVTVTGADRLVGLHVVGARVTARRSWPTGQQPNSVAVDARTGLVVVADRVDNSLQLITP